MNVFISHSSQDKRLAHDLSEFLNNLSCIGFVAHDDIEPSSEWITELVLWLNKMDFLIAICSQSFCDSPWCQQEIGWALGRNIPILSLKAGFPPMAFAGTRQALSITVDDGRLDFFKMERHLFHMAKNHAVIRDWIIKRIDGSFSWNNTNRIISTIIESGIDFTDNEKNEIVRIANQNHEVKHANQLNKLDFIVWSEDEEHVLMKSR
jgi:hypothetical protein